MQSEIENITDGLQNHRLSKWVDFHNFLESTLPKSSELGRPTYIWRGQRDSRWSLATSLDRLLERLLPSTLDQTKLEKIAATHLQAFKLASRGRRGQNPAHLEEIEWWALGQHFGLATPLLDWTHSPYAALYFAFEERSTSGSGEDRAVYALNVGAVAHMSTQLANGPSLESGRVEFVQIVDSLSDENARLVSQGGLFTRAPIGLPLERWVAQAFEGAVIPVLVKVLIPDGDRASCLRGLELMNISHTSLFPDLAGASRATNLKLELYPETSRR